MNRFTNRVAIVTGGGSGIGAAIVGRLASEGAFVAAIDRNREGVTRVCHEIDRGCGGEAAPFVFDLTDHDALTACVQSVHRQQGRVDILVNNAGISYYGDILEETFEQWRHTLAVNLEAGYLASKQAIPFMKAANYGRILFISSIQAFQTDGRIGAYAASKGAMNSLVHSMAVELAPFNIAVNAIAPGCIHTPLSIINGVDETETPLFKEWYVKHRKIPMARAGEPEEVAATAAFLVSDDCRYLTGQVIAVDGGLTITF